MFAYVLSTKAIELKDDLDFPYSDFIFIVALCIMLLIPMSHLKGSDRSDVENRMFNKFPYILINNKYINQKYGDEFNLWFSDRFNMRTELISLDTSLKCSLVKNFCARNGVILDKKTKVIYTPSFFGLPQIRKYKKEKMAVIADNLTRFNEFCKSKNIKLYLLIVPRRYDFVEISEAFHRKDYGVEYIEYFKKNTDIDIIYPYNELIEANKETPVFFKTDHHWSKKGAYVGYSALMEEIKKQYPDIKVLNEKNLEVYYSNLVSNSFNENLNTGSLMRQFGLLNSDGAKLLDTQYKYYVNKEKDNIFVNLDSDLPDFNDKYDFDIYYDKGYDKKVFVMGDSFIWNLTEFLASSFRRVVVYPDNNKQMYLYKYEKIINRYKPDIIVIVMRSSYIETLLNLYPNKFSKKEFK